MPKFLDLDGLGYYTSQFKPGLVDLIDVGAKNKIKYKSNIIAGYIETIGEVTFTVNTDLSITATSNGSAVASARTLIIYTGTPVHSAGDIISGGVSNQCVCACEKSASPFTDFGTDNGTGTIMTPTTNIINIFIRVFAGSAVNVTFKPMICTLSDWNISQSYVPYKTPYDGTATQTEIENTFFNN